MLNIYTVKTQQTENMSEFTDCYWFQSWIQRQENRLHLSFSQNKLCFNGTSSALAALGEKRKSWRSDL